MTVNFFSPEEAWTGRWCSGCGHQWDVTDPTTKPCDCPKSVEASE